MAKINLSPYTIKVREKNSNEYQNLDDLFGKRVSLFNEIKEIKHKYKLKPYKQDDSKKAFKFEDKELIFDIDNVKIIQDIVYYGEYGILRKIMNTETGEINKEDMISPEESPVYDLTFTYFQDTLIKKQGYIIVQSYSKFAYKTVFNELLKKTLGSILKRDVIVEINPIISSELIHLIEKGGRVVEIDLISNDVSKDSSDILLDSDGSEIEIKNAGKISYSLTCSKGKSLISLDKAKYILEKLKEMVLNSDATPFYEMTKCKLNEVKIKISTEIVTIQPTDKKSIVSANVATIG